MLDFAIGARVLISDRCSVTAGLRYRYTGPVWPVTSRNRWNSNFAVQPVRTGLPAGLAGLPVGLTGNRPNSNFFLFWFKFKCPQSILNEYLYNIFSLNEPSNHFLYYFYIVFVYFCMHVFLFNFKSPQTILNERIFEKI